MATDQSSSLTFYARTGRVIHSIYRDTKGEIRELSEGAGGQSSLPKDRQERLKENADSQVFQSSNPKKISLILTSKVLNANNKVVGYIDQIIEINEGYLKKLKARMNLELMLMLPNGTMAVATVPEFFKYNQKMLSDLAELGSQTFDLTVSGEPFRFLMQDVFWGDTPVTLALGASKANARSILRNVNYAFYTVLGAVIFLLTLTIIVISNAVLKPLNELVEATWNIQTYDHPVEIPIKSDTEIGMLTESFNHMSRNIIKARQDLRAKITELEKTNRELKDTQVRLVHTSKMVSLGQLVAGVAHELNNPIGFIFSNMAHLRDYSNRLIKLAETAEKEPEALENVKEELEIDFVRKDIFKLISSCEDGARRTRDIVLGLRNFSRLDEAKLSQIDVHQAIDNTLNLLAGELKNRVQVHKEYGSLPLVSCYASQINQVFMNILTNAIQAMPDKGNIWITTSQFKSSKGIPMIAVSIQDSGKGMSAATMEKIFDPFFSTKEVGQGTGLGLSISYGIVENHGGEIQVKSQMGIGTEFIIQIPVVLQRKAEVDQDPAKA
jgi:two-component system NtrC family sensor kinase